jgi:hypothetical protein
MALKTRMSRPVWADTLDGIVGMFGDIASSIEGI